MSDWEEDDDTLACTVDPFRSPIEMKANSDPFALENEESKLKFGFSNLKVDDKRDNDVFAFGQSESTSSWECSLGRGRGSRAGRGRGNSSCYKCHEEGHLSRDCPKTERNAESYGFGGFDKGNGFKCGENGHLSRDCPQGDGKGARPKMGFNSKSESSNKGKDGGMEEPDVGPRLPHYIPEEIADEDLVDVGIEAGINFENYETIPVKVSGKGPIADPVSSFSDMNVREILIVNIQKARYKNPTPIQKYAVPILVDGRDIMACAQTGSGKTVAYLLPILDYILRKNCDSHAYETTVQPVALILAPTRELAVQIFYEAKKLVRGSILLCRVAYGGASSADQLKKMQVGCHLLVGTVGRLVDYMQRGFLCFSDIKFIVLDEADRMLDMGFLSEIKKIFGHSTMPPHGKRQMLMFSATFPAGVQNLAATFMDNYVFVVVGTVGGANVDVTQQILEVQAADKKNLLVQFIKDMHNSDEEAKILVFVEKKKMADFVGCYLCNHNVKATTIHGDRYQYQRELALSTFRDGTFPVLVATAVAARGLDIRGVRCVINYDLPRDIDEYVHRIGRTGRVGNAGFALSFFNPVEDTALSKDLVKILSNADQEVPDWLKESAERSSLPPDNFNTGVFDVRRERKNGRDYGSEANAGGRNWNSSYLGGPSPVVAAADDNEEWES
ncbi:putative ATP-dependent RNA helicase ddx4 [Halocaridina rubra]|uniref:RNA helicase n=1 Tax=Halocaridina rubra TaxID=373956 RepID=A0AAN8XA44_HALRR